MIPMSSLWYQWRCTHAEEQELLSNGLYIFRRPLVSWIDEVRWSPRTVPVFLHLRSVSSMHDKLASAKDTSHAGRSCCKMSCYTRNTLSLQSQLQLANTPSSYSDHPHPITNSVWGSWIYIRCFPPGGGVVVHLSKRISTRSRPDHASQL